MSRDFILGVDLDGVCGDYTLAFRAVVAADRNVDPATLGDARSWDFAEWGVDSSEEFDRLHRLAVLEHRMFRDMPPMEGVAESLWRLSDAGVWIRIITHRLCVNWGHAVAVADTVSWLDATGIPYRDICFLGAKPEVEADCYVDDASHNVTALREAGNHVIVFDAPYNQDVDGPRARSWADVEELVKARVLDLGHPLQAQLPGLDAGADRLVHRVAGPRP
ncbi:MAG: 5' nucleotidase, NT5C type [Acidimicrobiales bacterium]